LADARRAGSRPAAAGAESAARTDPAAGTDPGGGSPAGSVTAEANLLGALALLVADQLGAAVEPEAGGSGSAAAALSALHHFLDRPTLDRLRRVLGLTPSGAVRLVDRLADAGLVVRGPGSDLRSRSVSLTPAGRRAAMRVSAARGGVLNRALADLTPAQRRTLHGLLGRVTATLIREKDGGAWTCRLCDLRACGRDEGRCPVANAAAARFGPAALSPLAADRSPAGTGSGG
jgi:DNA-binding MarR family transcriptional regulator